MFLNRLEIGPESKARDIVDQDYRTASVFDRYNIRYCCGLQRPLEEVCAVNDINLGELIAELHKVTRSISISPETAYNNWSVDFLIDYLINVHHHYMVQTLPEIAGLLDNFTKEHRNKYPVFIELNELFGQLIENSLPHLKQEEEVIFPYLRQIAHAYQDGDTGSFARLFVKTLRKPLASLIEQDHKILSGSILRFRQLTNNYTPAPGACTSHKVLLGKLRELDNDMVQHFHLENEILLPRVIAMEQELVLRG